MRALLWPLFNRSERALPDTVMAGTAFEDAVLASVLSVGIYSVRHLSGGDDR